MEQVGIEISNVVIDESNTIVISYINNETERLPKTVETYKRLYADWLEQDPPFISDIFKVQMRDIILASINNDSVCIEELDKFFSNSNIEEVKRFLVYMRDRDTAPARSLWTAKEDAAAAAHVAEHAT
jgi:hypothetical protein